MCSENGAHHESRAGSHNSPKNFAQLIAGCALDERQRRWFYGFLASEIGYGGAAAVARSLGVSPITVKAGLQEVAGSGERPDIKNCPRGAFVEQAEAASAQIKASQA